MLKRKNIVYIGGFELPDKNAAAQRVITNGRIFNKLGYNVTYIGVNKSDEFIESSIREYKSEDFTYYSKPQRYPKTNLEWIKFITDISFVKQTIEFDLESNVEIVIAYNYPAISLKKLIRFGKKNHIKIIADVTEWYEPQGSYIFRLIKGTDSYLRMNVFQKKIDGVIAISQFLYDYYEQKAVIKVPPLVDKSSLKWKKVITQKNHSILRLIYVGSPGNGQKDRLDLIINTLSKIRDKVPRFKLTIIGINENEYVEYFGDNAIPNNIKKNILFNGRIPHLEAIDELKKSDYSIFLRDNNLVNTAGFPTKFVESITCGTPVLTNKSSNVGDYLSDGLLGFELTLDSLEESLIKALNQSNSKILKMKEYCDNFIGFDFNSYVPEFENYFKRI